MKFLIVDDEPMFLELIENFLLGMGHDDTHAVSSADAALKAIQTSSDPFDCILLDIRMAGMDGIDLCKAIRSKPGYAKVPIVMVTSMTDKHYVDEAFRAGANDYLTKPIDSMEFRARIGMVEALAAEQGKAKRLLRKLNSSSSSTLGETRRKLSVPFESSVELEEAGGTMPLSSMENYLLRLGNLRMLTVAALGVHIENAAEIHSLTDFLEFADIMGEVALAIKESLGSASFMQTYAGSGDFCCIVHRTKQSDTSELEILINLAISNRLTFLLHDRTPLPHAKVGTYVTNGVLSLHDPTYVIYKSIENARHRVDARQLEIAQQKREHRYAS